MFGSRHKRTRHYEDWVPFCSRSSWIASGVWHFTEALAKAGLLIVLLVSTAMALWLSAGVRATILRVFPAWVVERLPDTPPGGAPKLPVPGGARPAPSGAQLRTPAPSKPPSPPAHFFIGSTKERVRAVQGAPDEATEEVWRYGGSEVYFKVGRVAGWRIAPGRPLKIAFSTE